MLNNTLRRIAGTALVLAFALSTLPAAAAEPAKVNLNTASAEQLALLPRVGPAISARIVEFREENGPFKSLEDLMLVRGIGEKTFELMKPYVALSGETTLTEKVRASQTAGTASSENTAGSESAG